MAPAAPDLTLLVPCFEEGARVERFADATSAFLERHPALGVEILFVDDGSRDDTASRLVRAAQRLACARVLTLATNVGKGGALKAGMADARGETVIFLDADLAVDLSHVERALALRAAGAEVVVGCRNVRGAVVERAQRLPRRLLGRAYRRLARLVLGLEVADVTCGFKAFRRETGQLLFERAACRRWGFDAEILFLAQRAGCVVRELPVRWFDGETSSVRLLRDVPGALRELLATRLRHAFRRAPQVPAEPPVAAARGLPAASTQEAGWP